MNSYERSRDAVTMAPAASVNITPIATVGHKSPDPSAKSATPANTIVNAARSMVYVFIGRASSLLQWSIDVSRIPR